MNIPDSLHSSHYNDRYFDVVSALDEARHIYVNGNRIPDRLAALPENNRIFHIGETGFGAARAFLAVIDVVDKCALENIDLHWYSVELHPLPVNKMRDILSCFNDRIGPLVAEFTALYASLDIDKSGWNDIVWKRPFGTVTLHLYIGEALDMASILPELIDAWVLDGHDPKKNPEMWRQELFDAIGAHTKIGGTFATFTAAGPVKRGLRAAGFFVVRKPGHGGKQHMIQGYRLDPDAVASAESSGIER